MNLVLADLKLVASWNEDRPVEGSLDLLYQQVEEDQLLLDQEVGASIQDNAPVE
jgi:hypothetical protein